MKISFFIPKAYKIPFVGYNYNKMPASSWIRCLQLIPYFEKLGINVSVNKIENGAKAAVFLRRWGADGLKLAKKLKESGIKILLDTPVNYFSNENHIAFQGIAKENFMRFADLADCIVCASEYIAEYGRGEGYNTVCIEDSIDFNHFCSSKPDFSKVAPFLSPSSLIWSGVSSKAGELNFLAPVIKSNSWNFIIISNNPPDLDFEYEFIKWDYKRFPKDILKGDIGIFPRECHDEYNKGHSFFKIGAFIAQQIPVICSPVPSYSKVITENNSIFIENLDPSEWEINIKTLIQQRNVHFHDNDQVYKFSTEKIVKKYADLFEE